MANHRLIHDVAFATSRHILEIFAGCIREDEHRDAFVEILEQVKAGIERFEMEHTRMQCRLHPTRK